MSPVIEYALIAMVAAYGLFGIYLASVRPYAVAVTVPVGTFRDRVPLDIDAWTRHDDRAGGFAFAVPPEWVVDGAGASAIRIGRSVREAAAAPEGDGILVERVALGERQEVQNLAALEFAGRRPALYDVAVDGRPALFAVAFENGHVRRQTVYVPLDGAALALRATSVDPAAFAAFVSTVKFYAPETLTPTP